MDKRFLTLLISVVAAGGLTIAVASLVVGPEGLAVLLPVTVLAALLVRWIAARDGH